MEKIMAYYVTINFRGSSKPYTYAVDPDSYKRLSATRETLSFPESATARGTHYETVRIVDRGKQTYLPPYVNKILTIKEGGVVTAIAYYNPYSPLYEEAERARKAVAAKKASTLAQRSNNWLDRYGTTIFLIGIGALVALFTFVLATQ